MRGIAGLDSYRHFQIPTKAILLLHEQTFSFAAMGFLSIRHGAGGPVACGVRIMYSQATKPMEIPGFARGAHPPKNSAFLGGRRRKRAKRKQEAEMFKEAEKGKTLQHMKAAGVMGTE